MPEQKYEKPPEHEDWLEHTDTVVLDREQNVGTGPRVDREPEDKPANESTS